MKKLAKTQIEEIQKPLKIGDIVDGKVIGSGRSSIFFDLGPIGTGIIYGKEFLRTKELLKDLEKGAVVAVKIIDLENENGYIEVSLGQASEEMAWEDLKEKRNNDENIKAKITGANKGGLIAKVSGLQAFLPVSQLSAEHYPRVEGGESMKIFNKLKEFIGQTLEVKVFDIDPKKEKLIISEKSKESNKVKDNLKNYKVGEVVEGEVTGLVDFGVFIKFSKKNSPEGIEGLIHISELDWKLISDPSEIVSVGQNIKAKIIEITNDKISLSLKELQENPWDKIEKEYKKGDKIKGKVVKINPFGVFIQITPKIQGLVHISEFESKNEMEKKLEVDKEYDFEIISIDSKKFRIILKMK